MCPPDRARRSLPGFRPGAGAGGWQRRGTQLLRVSTSSSLTAGTPAAAAKCVPQLSSGTETPGDFLNFGCPHPSCYRQGLVFFFFLGSCFSGAGGTALLGRCHLGCGGRVAVLHPQTAGDVGSFGAVSKQQLGTSLQ